MKNDTTKCKYHFDFVTFYNVFCRPFAKECDRTEETLLWDIFENKISSYSDVQNGIRKLKSECARHIQSMDEDALAQHLKNVLTYDPQKNKLDERTISIITERCNDNIYVLCKYAEDGTVAFHNKYLYLILHSDMIDTFNKMAMLFLDALQEPIQKLKNEDPQRKKHIEQSHELISIIERAKNDAGHHSLPHRYYGFYKVYYYSAHYANDIHCGLLRIYQDEEGNDLARMIFGFDENEKITKELRDMLEHDSDNALYTNFMNYINDTFHYRYDKRCYLMNGVVLSTDYKHFMKIDFYGTGSKINMQQTLYLNLTRVADYTNKGFQYRGGLGLMIIAPYHSTPKIRAYKMGLASDDIHISLENAQLKNLLKLEIDDKQRSQIQKDDDSAWWDFIIRAESDGEMSENTD